MKTIRIKELRTEAGLTQQELADRLGISKQAISAYETGSPSWKPTRSACRPIWTALYSNM